jgi:RNA polymerase sigma-70 factor (ECF subfamily)
MSEDELVDEEIVSRVQSGDRELFGMIVERYEKKLMRYGTKFLSNSEDVQDLVQDVFVSVYQNIQSFNRSQRFSPWIYRIAHNAFVSGIRKNSRVPILMFDFDTFVSHAVYEDPAQVERERKEMREMIDKGLGEISPKYKEILILHYMEDLSYKEIADILEVPTGTVGIRLKRAKEALRKIYEKLNLHYEK